MFNFDPLLEAENRPSDRIVEVESAGKVNVILHQAPEGAIAASIG